MAKKKKAKAKQKAKKQKQKAQQKAQQKAKPKPQAAAMPGATTLATTTSSHNPTTAIIYEQLAQGIHPDALTAPTYSMEAHGPALLLVLFTGDLQLAKKMLELGADPTSRDSMGVGALEQAAISGKVEMIELILSVAGDTEVASCTAIKRAIWMAVVIRDNDQVLRFLAAMKGVGVNFLMEGETPLARAIMAGAVENVRTLFELGADDALPGGSLASTFATSPGTPNGALIELELLDRHFGSRITTYPDLLAAAFSYACYGKYAPLRPINPHGRLSAELRVRGVDTSEGNTPELHAMVASIRLANHRKFAGPVLTNFQLKAVMNALRGTALRKMYDSAASPTAAPTTAAPTTAAPTTAALATAVRPPTGQPVVCFMWSKYGKCKYGRACLFAHTGSVPANPPAAPFTVQSAPARPSPLILEPLRDILSQYTVPGVYSP